MTDPLHQELEQVYRNLKVSKISHLSSKAANAIIEIGMYLCALIAFFSSFYIPLDPITVINDIDEQSRISEMYHHDAITSLMWSIRYGVYISVVIFFIAGLVARKLRLKNDQLMKVNLEIERLLKLSEPKQLNSSD